MKMLLSKLMVAVACMLCVLVVLLAPAEAASAQGVLPTGGLESPLVAGLGSGGGQQAAEEATARLSSPEVLAEDTRSRTAFSGYGRAQAVALAERVFGIGGPQWDASQDPGAGKITGYVGEDAAAEILPGGQHVLLDSSMPLRSVLGSGQLAPVSLSLSASGGGYMPTNPLVPIVIGKNAAEGVSFQFGLRVAPAQHEASEPSEVVGDSVFFPGTAKDTDFMLEPAPDGVEASWQILSAEGSSENGLSFALPVGASLVLSQRVKGAAEVLLEGKRLLLVMPASATQADGAGLPVSFAVSGNTLVTHVDLEGNVDFPVMVDPLITQEYGGGSKFWAGWYQTGTTGAYFEGGSGNEGILAGLDENYGSGAWAAWELAAPGAPNEGSITRVDVRGLEHNYGAATYLQSGIEGGDASFPVWTFNGTNPAETHSGLLYTGEWIKQSEHRAAAFCANSAGGYDGGPKPLCDEEIAGGEHYRLGVVGQEAKSYTQWSEIENTWVKFLDTSKITGNFGTGATTAGGYTNALGSGKQWFGPAAKTRFEYSAVDNAFGVASMTLQRWTGSAWETIESNNYETEGGCDEVNGAVCEPERSRELDYENLAGHLVNGEDKLRLVVRDPSGVEQIPWEPDLYVDTTPPQITLVAGEHMAGETINITEGQAGNWIHVQANDEKSGVWGSGIRSLAIEVDNHQIGGDQGSCSPEPCTGTGSWTLNGAQLGEGLHTLTVVATDNAGNIEHKTVSLIVHAAAPVAVGPGSVNPESGDLAMESADVDLKDSAGALEVRRHYDSRNVTEGAEGPLGPQWAIGLGSTASLEVIESEGKIEGVAVSGSGGVSFFPAKEGGGFESPPGDSSLKLTLVNSGKEYLLEDVAKGTSTSFTLPAGAKQWLPTVSTGAVATDTLTDTYKSVEVEKGKIVVEPTEELAPHGHEKCPPTVAEMQSGCRALLFYYGSEGSEQPEAKGENESEWGWYANQLTKVVAVAWNTSAGKMQEVAVAEYAYDKHGRLRAEWDPRIKPALKTIYGYDSENHVTAVSPPGEQPWLMTYGTAPEDSSTGRLIKIMRSKASTALWAGQQPTNSEKPTVSGVVALGKRLAVSNGKWEHAALSYGYQWERCNTSGGECSPIGGATNANYIPGLEDLYHTLRAKVTATNAGGSVAETTVHSVEVEAESWRGFVSHSETADPGSAIDAVSCLPGSSDCVLSDSKGNLKYATNVSSKAAASWSSWSGPGLSPSEAVACPTSGLCLLAAGSSDEGAGNLYYATSLGGSWSEAYSPSYGVDAIACVSSSLCVDGQDGDGYLRASTKPASTSWSQVTQGSAKMTAATCLSSAFCVIADNAGKVHVAVSSAKIESGSWTETDVDGSTALTGVACVSKTSCLAIDGTGGILALTINSETGAVTTKSKTSIDGSNVLTAISCAGSICVAVDSKGNVLYTPNGGTSWGSVPWELGGDLTSVSCASSTLCVTAGTSGQETAFNPSEPYKEESGAEQTPQAGTTIEYNVPVSGSSAPHPMGAKEVEVWGQTDPPAEGTEIFPEEHPQGWPASGSTGATAYYTDNAANTVNVVTPAGGISTAEYEKGDIIRALTSDNREKALKEPNPAVAAEKLATKSKYNTENNLLTEVTGPEHKVKLSNGEEVNARNHARYFYDEGAPENSEGKIEEHGLLTKATDGALLSNGEERDVRTTLTGYSGQSGLGWTLHAPTSTTTEPNGVDLVSSTLYNKETGAVEETRTPGGNAETVSPPVFANTFGKAGSGEGQFKEASAVAVGLSGEVFVDDRGDGRIEKFSSSGSFERVIEAKLGKFSGSWGIAVSPKTGDVFVADSGHHEIFVFSPAGAELRSFGSTGEGSLSLPTGISVTPAGEVWVANDEANKVEEFSEEGKYLASIGEGHLKEPGDVSVEDGEVYVTSEHSVAIFTHKGEYTGSFGSEGSGSGQFASPTEIVAAPGTGDLLVDDRGNERVEEFNPAGKFLTEWGAPGSGDGEFSGISGLAISTAGTIYTSETGGDRVQAFTPAQAGAVRAVYSTQWGSYGSGHGEFLYPGEPAVTSNGHVLVTDNEADDVQEFTPQGKYLATYGSKGEGNGQMSGPTGLTVNQSTGEILVAECANDRIQVLKAEGKYVREFGRGQLSCPGAVALDSSGDAWVADSDKNRIVEYGPTGTLIAAYGSEGTGHVQFNDPTDIKVVGSDVDVSDTRNDRIEILNLKGEWVGQIGSEGNGGGQFEHPEGIAVNEADDMFVLNSGGNNIEEFGPEGHYLQSIATHGIGEGQLNAPQGIAVTPAGDIDVADAGNHRIERWIPDSQAVHDTKTIYYSGKEEAGVEACDNRPQWAGLACRTEPLAQPLDSSAEPKGEELPQLPVVTTEYNMWYQTVKTTEVFGKKTRTKTTTYEGERPTIQAVEASVGKTVPAVHDKYSTTLGSLDEQSIETEHEGTKATSQVLNTLGQLESYTDSEGNATTYKYDQYGRPIEVADDASKLDHMEAKQKLTYAEATGLVTEVEDQGGEGTYEGKGAGTFKASYDVEGNMTSETYPNAMTAVYGYNSIGEGTSLTYTKNNHCTGSECQWFEDTLTPSIHGEMMLQNSGLAKEQYRYEGPGRLAEVQETPTGEHCTARIYASNEEGDRTSLTTRESGTGECTATEGGKVERHTYDEGNRNTDEEVQYEPLGNIAKLPAADAGKYELETEYYADGQVRSQTQHEATNSYLLDPEGRTRLTETVVKLQATNTISHYPGPGGSAPSWTYNQTAGTWARDIAGFGGLAAVEESGKQAVLQIRDLQGNIVGTASLSEAVGKPQHMERSTEYGVPLTEKPEDKYGWLGTIGVSPSLPSGSIVQDGSTYVPQLGTALQTAATPEPAVSNVVTPFVITVPPFVPAAYVEAQSKSEAGGAPGGNKPAPGGEETDCTGMKACTASHKKQQAKLKCYVKDFVGESKGWVWSHAYAWCPGMIMQRASYLQTCLFQEEVTFADGIASEPYCGDAVIGEKDPHQLYAHYHEECGEEGLYYGAGKFWLPGWNEPEEFVSPHGYQCKETTLEAYANFFWALAEDFEGWNDAGTD